MTEFSEKDISSRLNALLTDERFLRPSSMRGRPNLFETVAAYHMVITTTEWQSRNLSEADFRTINTRVEARQDETNGDNT